MPASRGRIRALTPTGRNADRAKFSLAAAPVRKGGISTFLCRLSLRLYLTGAGIITYDRIVSASCRC